jgi:hypothetical protein
MELVNRNRLSIREATELELTAAQAASVKAMIDYNIMMGTFEDPAEEDEDDE